MSITLNPKLYVTLQPLEHVKPHPINDGRFDPAYAYKVLGVYNASETSECFFILSNTYNEIWFISQRHLRAYKILDSDELYLELEVERKESILSLLTGKPVGNSSNGSH
jgi:hypothetical protein